MADSVKIHSAITEDDMANNLWSRIMRSTLVGLSAGVNAFREEYLTGSVIGSDDFEEFNARRLRYEIYRASYENTTYRNIHPWAQGMRNRYGLYKYIRNIYNPTRRLVEFYGSMIWPGAIAPGLAGGAIPLVVSGESDDERVRNAVDVLCSASNLNVQKGIIARSGANLGDVGIRVRDDAKRGQVRLELVRPEDVEYTETDNGIVKGYRLVFWRELEASGITAQYVETCERGDNDDVVYRTYINGAPAAWPGVVDKNGTPTWEWVEPYGFIPMVMIQHINIGEDWGWAEAHPLQSLIQEADGLGSMLDDFIRKTVNAPALISGMSEPKTPPKTTGAAATADRPMPGREETPILWATDANTKYTPMIPPFDIANSLQSLDRLLQEIERNYPELKDISSAAGDASGRALRVARQGAEAKVLERRPNYDGPLARAFQMGVAIGGWRGYNGYEGFDLTSYANGKLDLSIGDRPVFPVDVADKRAELQTLWATVAQSVSQGIPAETVMRSFGWNEDQIEQYQKERQSALNNPDFGL